VDPVDPDPDPQHWLRRVASFRPYTSKQVGDTGPAESARRSNSRAFGSSFSGARGTTALRLHREFLSKNYVHLKSTSNYKKTWKTNNFFVAVLKP
jgi:hypothetical protein